MKKLFLSLLLSGTLVLQAEEEKKEAEAPAKPKFVRGEYCMVPNCLWTEFEFLYWNVKDFPKVIPLVKSGTETVLGGKKIHEGTRSGGRFTVGYWADDCHTIAAEARYFFLPEGSNRHDVRSIPNQTLTIPFFDVTIQGESSTNLSLENVFRGKARLEVENKIQGAELNGIYTFYSMPRRNIVGIGGLRWIYFSDRLNFTTSSPLLAVPDDVFKTKDSFATRNNFFGAQIGFDASYHFECFALNLRALIAAGAVHTTSAINGKLLTNDFTPKVKKYEGGYFALPTNIGHKSRTQFCYIPEVDVKFVYNANACFSVFVGYTGIYVSDVVWASGTMSRKLNPSQSVAITDNPNADLLGPKNPKTHFGSESVWVQGLNLGFDWRY